MDSSPVDSEVQKAAFNAIFSFQPDVTEDEPAEARNHHETTADGDGSSLSTFSNAQNDVDTSFSSQGSSLTAISPPSSHGTQVVPDGLPSQTVNTDAASRPGSFSDLLTAMQSMQQSFTAIQGYLVDMVKKSLPSTYTTPSHTSSSAGTSSASMPNESCTANRAPAHFDYSDVSMLPAPVTESVSSQPALESRLPSSSASVSGSSWPATSSDSTRQPPVTISNQLSHSQAFYSNDPPPQSSLISHAFIPNAPTASHQEQSTVQLQTVPVVLSHLLASPRTQPITNPYNASVGQSSSSTFIQPGSYVSVHSGKARTPEEEVAASLVAMRSGTFVASTIHAQERSPATHEFSQTLSSSHTVCPVASSTSNTRYVSMPFVDPRSVAAHTPVPNPPNILHGTSNPTGALESLMGSKMSGPMQFSSEVSPPVTPMSAYMTVPSTPTALMLPPPANVHQNHTMSSLYPQTGPATTKRIRLTEDDGDLPPAKRARMQEDSMYSTAVNTASESALQSETVPPVAWNPPFDDNLSEGANAAAAFFSQSGFLPPGMLEMTTSDFRSRRGPLTTCHSSSDLAQELASLPFFAAFEMYRLANSVLTVDNILRQRPHLQALRKVCEAYAVGTKGTTLTDIAKAILAFLPRDKRYVFTVKTKVWQALVEENKLRHAGHGRELGNPDDMKDTHYGGKVRFRAVLTTAPLPESSGASAKPGKRPALQLELKPATVAIGNSNRLTKLYGSDAFLCVKIDDPSLKSVDPTYLQENLCNGIQLGASLYHAWYIKEGTALFINTALRTSMPETRMMDSDQFFLWFINRHNPPDMNKGQTAGKWAKRMQLLWSSSIPGPQLPRMNITPDNDIVAEGYKHMAKPPAERDMTDGAGLMTWAVARDIQVRMGLRYLPCAIQHRTGSSKGMQVLCPPYMDEEAIRRIWLRPSQIKIKYRMDQLDDPSLRTMELLSASAFTAPARITTQLIVLLAENRVPNLVLIDLMVDSLKAAVQPFFDPATKPIQLSFAIEDLCNIMQARLRKAGSVLRGNSVEELSLDEEDIEEHPASHEESAYLCLLSGFTMAHSVYLRRRVKEILARLIQGTTADMRFRLPRCVEGKIIPDPTGKLRPGQIFVQFRREYDISDMESVKILTGDVLITRHPCKLPTDIQKMQAVDIDELHYLYDVIVMSIQGDRSPASMLGGGDYDGDRATVVWEPSIVEPFQNADASFADQPPDFDRFLERDPTTLSSVLDKMNGWSAEARRLEIQKYLLCDLKNDFQMQGYSNRHDVALYTLGAHHPKTVELAHKYMISLDSSKSGIKVKPSVFASKEDQQFDREHPWKLEDGKGSQKFALGPRPKVLGHFVLDQFKAKAKHMESKLLAQYDGLYSPRGENGVEVYRDHPLDDDLTRPWRDFVEKRRGDKFEAVRRAITEHVKMSFAKYKEMNQDYAKSLSSGVQLIRSRNERLKEVRDFYITGPEERTWSDILCEDECDTYKASYCYMWEMGQHSARRGEFPFEVAHRTLCSIKARASKTGAVAITGSAYNVLRIDNRLLKNTLPLSYDAD